MDHFKVATSSVAAFTFECIQHLKVCRVLFRQFSLNSYIGDNNLSILSNKCFSLELFFDGNSIFFLDLKITLSSPPLKKTNNKKKKKTAE